MKEEADRHRGGWAPNAGVVSWWSDDFGSMWFTSTSLLKPIVPYQRDFKKVELERWLEREGWREYDESEWEREREREWATEGESRVRVWEWAREWEHRECVRVRESERKWVREIRKEVRFCTVVFHWIHDSDTPPCVSEVNMFVPHIPHLCEL